METHEGEGERRKREELLIVSRVYSNSSNSPGLARPPGENWRNWSSNAGMEGHAPGAGAPVPRSALVFAPAAPGHWMLGHADQPVVIPIAPQARSVRVLHQVVGEPDVRFPLEVFSSSLSALCHLRRNGLRLVALGSPLLARVLERCITIERGAIGFERDEYTPRILLDAGELSTKPASAICRDNVAINS